MKHLSILLIALCSFAYTSTAQTTATATPIAEGASGSREQDNLKGPVRRVRVETANIVTRNGKQVELPKSVVEVSTYDALGRKIDSVAYPVEGATAPGKEEYKYDSNGNLIEMTLRSNDGSVLSQEKYTYELDEFGNWKKMTTAVAIYENGTISYEPTQVTYRTLTYYYGPATLKPGGPAAPVTAPAKQRTDAEAAPVENKPAQTKPPAVVPPANDTEKPVPVTPANTEAPASKEDVKLPILRIPEEALRQAAVVLPEPQYPANAELARASGPVQVELIIDQNGVVTMARATSGNPMLFDAATSAARKARFLMSAFPITRPGRTVFSLTILHGQLK